MISNIGRFIFFTGISMWTFLGIVMITGVGVKSHFETGMQIAIGQMVAGIGLMVFFKKKE